MTSPYTPNPANNPSFITLPDPGDPVASAVAGQAWKDLADLIARRLKGFVAGETGVVNGTVNVASGGEIFWDAGSRLTVNASCTEVHANTPTFTGIQVNTNATVNGTMSVGGSGVLDLNGNGIVRKSVALTSAGRIKERILEEAGTGDVTTNAASYDLVAYLGLTADRVLILTSTGAEVGDKISVTLVPLGTNAFKVDVKNDALTGLITLHAPSAGGNLWAEFSYFATGGWRLTKYENV